MTSLFLVTSTIYTSYGKCSTKECVGQTKETIKSIETYGDIIFTSRTEKQSDVKHFLYNQER